MNKTKNMSPKISSIPVETCVFDDAFLPVHLCPIKELSGRQLRLRRSSNRHLGKGKEDETDVIFVWTRPKTGRSIPGWATKRPRRQLRKNTKDSSRVRYIDVFRLRDQFFEIKNPEQGVRFFAEFGIFGAEYRDSFQTGLSFADLLGWQELLKECWLTEPSEWETLTGRYSRLPHATDVLQIPEFSIDVEPSLRMRLQCESVRDAIMAATYLDKLSKVKSSMCQRPDCHVVFKHESGHERKYCSPECAHVEAVRRHRRNRSRRERD